jgi:hypothetical protein
LKIERTGEIGVRWWGEKERERKMREIRRDN